MILMAMVVRDESDIVAANLEHHLASGVDRIAILDNGSTDGTAEILDGYARAGVAEVSRDDPPGFRLAEALDRLVRRAVERHRPEWVLTPDADEFVVAPDGDLRAALAAHPADHVLRCERDNMIGSLQDLDALGWRRALVHVCTRDLRPPAGHADPRVALKLPYFCFRLPPKVIFRPQGLRRMGAGSHTVELDPAAAPMRTMIRMRHFPIRSAAEFLRSLRRYAAILDPDRPGIPQPSGKYRRWRAMLAEPDGRARVLAEALPNGADLAAGLRDGTYKTIRSGIDWLGAEARARARMDGRIRHQQRDTMVCDH